MMMCGKKPRLLSGKRQAACVTTVCNHRVQSGALRQFMLPETRGPSRAPFVPGQIETKEGLENQGLELRVRYERRCLIAGQADQR